MEVHRKKHFGDAGLNQTAIALHIQGLKKRNMEENLTGDLAEQVEAYRSRIKSTSTQVQDINAVRFPGHCLTLLAWD
jgi:uncharacterized protein YbgA (DUF1722 family)